MMVEKDSSVGLIPQPAGEERKPYMPPVLEVIASERTASGILGAANDGTNATTATNPS
jgi:hypothetical protein